MANCIDCGEKIPFFNNGIGGRCNDCTRKHQEALEAPEREREAARLAKEKQGVESVLVTTENSPTLNISRRLKIVISTVDSVLDAKLIEKQDELILGLKREAYLVGANAVVGVSINIVETYSASAGVGNFKKFKIVAYGTAVVVERLNPDHSSSP